MKVRRKKEESQQNIKTSNQNEEISENVCSERKICFCFGKIHKLIGNCQSCGKVICSNEGEPDCLFCHNPIFPNDESDLVSDKYFEKAISHQQKLLEFQADVGSKKNIIDDQNDWFEVKHDIWQSTEVRKMAEEKMNQKQIEEKRRKELIVYDIDMKTGKVEGKEVLSDAADEKSQVRNFLEQIDQKSGSNLKFIENEIDDENLRNAVREIKSGLESKKKTEKPDQVKKPLSKIVQNDMCFDVLLEYERVMQQDRNQKANKK